MDESVQEFFRTALPDQEGRATLVILGKNAMKTERTHLLKTSILTGIIATVGLIIGVLFASGQGWTSGHLAGMLRRAPSQGQDGSLIMPASLPLTVDERGSSPFVAVTERLLPSVVHIKVTTNLKRGAGDVFGFGPDMFGIPDDQFHQDLEEMSSSGTGFIIDNDGYILTNNHVIENASELTVVLSNKKEVAGKVIGSDPETDVALVKIDADDAAGRAAPLGDSDEIRVGDWAIAIGNPYGLEQSVTVGVISATGRANLNIAGGGPVFQNFIQTDASINFGNSGGPLVNINGQVVAINTAINTRAQGIGFAIPINMARKVYLDLRERGAVVRGYLGMVPRDLTAELKKALRLDEDVQGIFVDSVQDDGPAAAGDLAAGDVVLEWNGKAVTDVTDFRMQVAQTAPGQKVKARILREGDERTLNFVLADRAEALKTEPGAPGLRPEAQTPDKLGLEVAEADDSQIRRYNLDQNLVKRNGGVVITAVRRESPARGHLNVGDVITRIDRSTVRSVRDFVAAEKELTENQSAILVHVIRGNRKTIEAIDLGE
jgi:serine protease Do